MDENWKKLDEAVKRELIIDKELNNFLTPIFLEEKGRKLFIENCLKKIKTRRMLLRSQWYIEMADDQEKGRHNRPALKIIFLMALAESITKTKIGTDKIGSLEAIQEFFKLILPEDKQYITRTFQRALISPKHHVLRFTSIVRILYDVRNKAVHGEDYYSFSLLGEEQKKQHKHYTHFGMMTFGQLGKRYKKRRVPVDTTLTYEELRDIIRRTAVENIKKLLT